MIGQTFGRLTVTGPADSLPNGKSKLKAFLCECVCGIKKVIAASNLQTGRTRSCGCLVAETAKLNIGAPIKHEQCWSPTYSSWAGMKDRCTNQNHKSYNNYGGRGITVCERWMDFRNFLEDMGERPEGMSIDRIDVNGDYEPGNCRWATAEQQSLNKRNSTSLEK